MKKYFMVLNTSTNYTRYRHKSYDFAKIEAMRLARENPGHEFVVLGAKASIKKQDLIIDEIEEAEEVIPF